jgi:serine/threonine protein phosphatase PrpC
MDPKKVGQKRHSTINFTSNFSKNLEKLMESDNITKSSKKGTKQSDGPITLIDNNIKSSILSLNLLTKKYTDYEEPKCSQKPIGPLKSFSHNTYQGLFKDYNEDRVSVNSLVKKPSSSKIKSWPKISYFAIFDGHGGEECSEFLKNNYLNYLIENKNFPFDIKISMIETCQKIEEDFFKQKCSDNLEESDKSGSCALIAVIFDNKIYIANIGDSRAIMSMNGGVKIKQLTTDHKPENIKEYERAIKNGSKIYLDDNDEVDRDISKLNFVKDKADLEKKIEIKQKNTEEKIFRVYPSDLAVMRTIGDIKAKKKEFGALPGTVINTPDIFVYDLNGSVDFIVMGCDGIFDDLSNQEIINAAWLVFKNRGKEKNYDMNELTKEACDIVMKFALEKQTSDNLSCIIIGFEGIEKFIKMNQLKKKVNNSMNNFKKELKRAASIK